jgi:hypothetical protein
MLGFWPLAGAPLADDNVATASGNDIAGTTTIVFTPAATLTGRGSSTATATLTFSQTATLTGFGNIAATSTLVFSPTATLTGRGSSSATATLTFTPSATLTGRGALSGTSTLVFTPIATLTGRGSIAGTSSIVFNVSGTLFVPASNNLSGTTSITFNVAASISNIANVPPLNMIVAPHQQTTAFSQAKANNIPRSRQTKPLVMVPVLAPFMAGVAYESSKSRGIVSARRR